MAKSRFEYVKTYEMDDRLLPGCWIVVRLDGKGFTRFSDVHRFEKPNDAPALDLMNAAARAVMREFPDMRIAFGESDEYSFVIHKSTEMYGRRASKIISLVTSCFTANYVHLWPQLMGARCLEAVPIFDGRVVCYPDVQTLRDYLSWRQADTHINNQYNTCFWALVKSGISNEEAQQQLKGTDAAAKNELLYSRFHINYNTLPDQFKKGSIIVKQKVPTVVKHRPDGTPVQRLVLDIVTLHCDLIGKEFWDEHPEILA